MAVESTFFLNGFHHFCFFHCQLPSAFVGLVHRITGGSERPRGGGQNLQDATESARSSLLYRAGIPGTPPPSGRVSRPLQFLVTPSIMGFNVRAKHRSEHPRSRFMRAYQPSILGVTKLAVKSENELLKHGGNIWG